MRLAIVCIAIVLLGAGCTDNGVSSIQGVSDTVKAKAAEVSAAFESAKQTLGKVQAIYNILTPSVPPSEDQPQPAVEENTSSQ